MVLYAYSIYLLRPSRSVKLVTRAQANGEKSVEKKTWQSEIIMADVNKRMRSVQHGYGGLSATMEHRETDTGSHGHDEVSK